MFYAMKFCGFWTSSDSKLPSESRPHSVGIAQIAFPNYDGNGRTARLLTTLILHLGDYGLKGRYALRGVLRTRPQSLLRGTDRRAVPQLPHGPCRGRHDRLDCVLHRGHGYLIRKGSRVSEKESQIGAAGCSQLLRN